MYYRERSRWGKANGSSHWQRWTVESLSLLAFPGHVVGQLKITRVEPGWKLSILTWKGSFDSFLIPLWYCDTSRKHITGYRMVSVESSLMQKTLWVWNKKCFRKTKKHTDLHFSLQFRSSRPKNSIAKSSLTSSCIFHLTPSTPLICKTPTTNNIPCKTTCEVELGLIRPGEGTFYKWGLKYTWLTLNGGIKRPTFRHYCLLQGVWTA